MTLSRKMHAVNDEGPSGARPGDRLYRLLADEHARLDRLLAQASKEQGVKAAESYQRFRETLLRHISIEEKILLPAIRRIRGGVPHPLAARLKLDHGALAALMMLPPLPSTFRAVRAVLDAHNPLEDAPGGLYDQCQQIAGLELDSLIEQSRSAPQVTVSPWSYSPKVLAAAKRLLARGGYDPSLLDDSN